MTKPKSSSSYTAVSLQNVDESQASTDNQTQHTNQTETTNSNEIKRQLFEVLFNNNRKDQQRLTGQRLRIRRLVNDLVLEVYNEPKLPEFRNENISSLNELAFQKLTALTHNKLTRDLF